jgi:ABC-type proline/glycine betaine transport system substrate-binding protein
MPAYSANIALSTSVASQAPKFAAMLKAFRISVPEMDEMLKKVDLDKQSVSSVASSFIGSHASQISAWTKSA